MHQLFIIPCVTLGNVKMVSSRVLRGNIKEKYYIGCLQRFDLLSSLPLPHSKPCVSLVVSVSSNLFPGGGFDNSD